MADNRDAARGQSRQGEEETSTMTELAFTPLRIGPVEAPNRLALAPVKTALGGTDGRATMRHVEYYRRRAVGEDQPS